MRRGILHRRAAHCGSNCRYREKEVKILHFAVRLVALEPRCVTVKSNRGEMVLPGYPKSEDDQRSERRNKCDPSGGKIKASRAALSLLWDCCFRHGAPLSKNTFDRHRLSRSGGKLAHGTK
jgi:hypothetical protein